MSRSCLIYLFEEMTFWCLWEPDDHHNQGVHQALVISTLTTPKSRIQFGCMNERSSQRRRTKMSSLSSALRATP